MNDKTITTRRELRQFGVGLALLCCLIGGVLVWKGQAAGLAVILAGVLVVLAFWFDCPGVRAFYTGWMRLARVMARIITTVLLTLLYVLVLTPIALLGRACGQRFVERGFREGCDSYWVSPRPSVDRSSCEKQF